MPKRQLDPSFTTSTRPTRKSRGINLNHDSRPTASTSTKFPHFNQTLLIDRGQDLAGLREYKALLQEALQVVCKSVAGAPSFVPRSVVSDVLRDVLASYDVHASTSLSAHDADQHITVRDGEDDMVRREDLITPMQNYTDGNTIISSYSTPTQHTNHHAPTVLQEYPLAHDAKLKLRQTAATRLCGLHRPHLLTLEANHGVQVATTPRTRERGYLTQAVKQQSSGMNRSQNPKAATTEAKVRPVSVAALADMKAPVLIVEAKEQYEIWTRLLAFEARLQVDTEIAAVDLLAVERILEEFTEGEMRRGEEKEKEKEKGTFVVDGKGFGLRWCRVLRDVDAMLRKYAGGKIQVAWWREFRMWRYLVKGVER